MCFTHSTKIASNRHRSTSADRIVLWEPHHMLTVIRCVRNKNCFMNCTDVFGVLHFGSFFLLCVFFLSLSSFRSFFSSLSRGKSEYISPMLWRNSAINIIFAAFALFLFIFPFFRSFVLLSFLFYSLVRCRTFSAPFFHRLMMSFLKHPFASHLLQFRTLFMRTVNTFDDLEHLWPRIFNKNKYERMRCNKLRESLRQII